MNQTISKLMDETMTGIRSVLGRFRNPAVMSSFGKDSLVLLHCLREAGFDLPIIYLKDPWQPHKHMQAEEVIRSMGLTVHNWPPSAMGVKFNGERLEFVARYNFSDDAYIDIPKNIEPQLRRQKLLCGLFDIIRRPTSVIRHDWDVILLGHKNSDIDQYYGSVPLELDIRIARRGMPALYFPLRNWSDDDIWTFIEEEHLTIQATRYSNRAELDDKSFNNDYVQCCSRCLDPREGPVVDCPKFGKQISNVFEHIPHFDEKPEYIGGVGK